MIQFGYQLSSEEHGANDLIRLARRAEEEGFHFAFISDHFHPWIDKQGESPFVWSVLGGIAQATRTLKVATGVTCPTIRIHPAIIAHAAATVATMMPGRFLLGLGSGENLNEHILGDPWPAADLRLEMLEEAILVIRQLWQGGMQTFRGAHYTVEKARIYSLPERPPPILVAASGPRSAELAGREADGLVVLAPDPDLLRKFTQAAGAEKPSYGQIHFCWARSQEEALEIAHQYWPTSALGGGLFTEIALPEHFDQLTKLIRKEDVAKVIPHGPDPQTLVEEIQKYAEAGYDHIVLHQVGPQQEEFIRFFSSQLKPVLEEAFSGI